MGRVTFIELLKTADDLSSLIDPEVKSAAERLGLSSDEVTLAGACLGSPVEAVAKLQSTGLLPGKMPDEGRKALADWLETDPDTLDRSIASNRDQVAGFLGLPIPKADRTVAVPAFSEPDYGLFPHQWRALQRLHRLLSEGRDRMLLHMPTGGGKTRTAMNLVADRLRRFDDGAVLWVASTKELLEQAAHEFANAWRYLGNRKVPIHAAWGGRDWEPDRVTDGLLVASPQTLHQMLRQQGAGSIEAIGRRLQLILFDEAHQAIATTYEDVTERLAFARQPFTPIVGLTATPGRTFAGSAADDALADFFAHTKVMLDTSAEGGPANPVDYLIEHGYLANPEFVLLGEVNESQEDQVSYEMEDEVEMGYPLGTYIDRVTTATLELAQEGHQRILVFTATVELAHLIASVLRVAGVYAQSVDGGTDAAVRDTMIREYKTRSNETRILVNHGVLTTGFDAPQTSAAVIARPTRSLVLYSQMVGRAIRGPKADGNKQAKVVTVVDPSIPAYGSIAQAFAHWNSYWEGQHA